MRAAVLVGAVAFSLSACELVEVAQEPTVPVQPPGAPAPGATAAELTASLGALQIQPEDTGAHYDRDDWMEDWARNGQCTTRETILQRDGKGVVVNEKCAPTAGSWFSVYDGVTTSDPSELQIDHIVPLAEVARSGPVVNGRRARPGSWPEDQRRAYANDPEGLVAVTGSSNQSKSDDDPARWMPSYDPCGYLAKWLHVKKKYNLSVDQTEHDAIASVIGSCPQSLP
jgi:hypothetical protein